MVLGGVAFRNTADIGRNGVTGRTADWTDSGGGVLLLKRLYRNGSSAEALDVGKKEGFTQEMLPRREKVGYAAPKRKRTLNGSHGLKEKLKESVKESLNGKEVPLNGANLQEEGSAWKEPENSALAVRHHPLLDSLCEMIHGNGAIQSTVPVTEEMVGDISYFFYLTWMAQHHPEDETAKMEREHLYSKRYICALITLKDQFASQGGKETAFITKTRQKVWGAAGKMAKARERLDAELGVVEAQLDARLAELRREADALDKIDEKYERKDARVDEFFEKESRKKGQLLDFARKYGLKYGVPIGAGMLTLSATVWADIKAWIFDITEHIPVISAVPPEIIGLATFGIWGAYHIGKMIYGMRLKSSKVNSPVKAEKAKEKVMKRIVEDETRARMECMQDAALLRDEFEKGLQAIIEGLREEYRGMLRDFSSASAN